MARNNSPQRRASVASARALIAGAAVATTLGGWGLISLRDAQNSTTGSTDVAQVAAPSVQLPDAQQQTTPEQQSPFGASTGEFGRRGHHDGQQQQVQPWGDDQNQAAIPYDEDDDENQSDDAEQSQQTQPQTPSQTQPQTPSQSQQQAPSFSRRSPMAGTRSSR